MVKYFNNWLRFSKSFPYVKIRKRSRASLIIVKNLSEACVTDAEKVLYDQLRTLAYYPTPHYLVNGVNINLALVPYRLALIEIQPGLNEKRVIRLLKRRSWNVLFYDRNKLIQDKHSYLNLVLKFAPGQTKNISTSS